MRNFGVIFVDAAYFDRISGNLMLFVLTDLANFFYIMILDALCLSLAVAALNFGELVAREGQFVESERGTYFPFGTRVFMTFECGSLAPKECAGGRRSALLTA